MRDGGLREKEEEELEERTRGRWFVLIRHGGVDRQLRR